MKFLADENFDGRVIRALRRRDPGLDLVRAVDVGLGGAADPDVLAWAAAASSHRVGSSTRAFSSSSFLRAGSQSKSPPEQFDRLLDVGLGGLDIRSHGNLRNQKNSGAGADSARRRSLQWAETRTPA